MYQTVQVPVPGYWQWVGASYIQQQVEIPGHYEWVPARYEYQWVQTGYWERKKFLGIPIPGQWEWVPQWSNQLVEIPGYQQWVPPSYGYQQVEIPAHQEWVPPSYTSQTQWVEDTQGQGGVRETNGAVSSSATSVAPQVQTEYEDAIIEVGQGRMTTPAPSQDAPLNVSQLARDLLAAQQAQWYGQRFKLVCLSSNSLVPLRAYSYFQDKWWAAKIEFSVYPFRVGARYTDIVTVTFDQRVPPCPTHPASWHPNVSSEGRVCFGSQLKVPPGNGMVTLLEALSVFLRNPNHNGAYSGRCHT